MRTLAAVATLAGAGLAALALRPAQGAAGSTGYLATGGTAKGDIASSAAETDTIGVDLVGGSKLGVKWTSAFPATVGVFDPSGAPVPMGIDGTREKSISGWAVPASGRYEFRIASADGSQGLYTLQVRPYWDKRLVLDGTGEATLDVPMPAAGRIKGKVQPRPGASNPSILSFQAPSGTELLIAPVVGTVGLAKLKTIACPEDGVYRMTAAASAGTQAFRATLKRSAPKIPLVTIDLRNGLDVISFATGGVADYFGASCASCHAWADSYAGVRAYARQSVTRMASGNMPPDGPPADAATVALVRQWIASGMSR